MTLILIKLHLLIGKKCSQCWNISFTTCPMQLQCPTWLVKWLRMSLATSNQPLWLVTLISIKLHLLIGHKDIC
jgi:hypothetical protein